MIVAFVTMLLGLTAGAKTIEVAVSEPVARVEMLLDGAPAGVLTAEPWSLEIDLGAELAPHLLVAIARDAGGGELGRAEQWINLPHEPVEAQLLLDIGVSNPGVDARSAFGPEKEGLGQESSRRPGSWGGAVRLIWSAVGQDEPEQISVSFDGEPLEVEDPGRIPLPDHDPRGMHFLRAELRFATGAEAVAEAAFGGLFGDHVATEIQALALDLDPGARLPEPAGLSGWFTEAGNPASGSPAPGDAIVVRAVDAGPADVIMVVDLAAHPALEELKRSNVVHQPARRPRRERADPNLPGYTPQPGPGRRSRSRATPRVAIPAGLHERDRLRFAYPVARPGDPYRIFPISEPFTLEDGGLFDILTRVNLPADAVASQRLADAVAVAGIQTYAGHRRRIVVLVLGDDPVDASRFRLPAVRRYLSRLRVPLLVWRVRESASDVYRPGGGPGTPEAATRLDAGELGPAVEISSIKQLKAALGALRQSLDAQRIVWVEGHHLPQRIELGAAATGVRWAGDRN